MAITSLSIQQIAAVIREQMADPVTSGASGAPALKGRSAPNSPKTPAARSKSGSLSKLIVKRIGALRHDDAERGRKAFRIFLESVLLNELGENLINDPRFYQMVDDIQHQMESNPDLAGTLGEAIGQLLAGAAPEIEAKS